ncbi:MAG: 4Fe-4S binding protein [Desulfobacteraceae bacterium]|nr:4Fe-4S binding protein [Desulfobacteraceae bacterium]
MDTGKNEKLKQATAVVCRQGMIPFPVSDTAMAIIHSVVGDNDEQLDLIYAFREKSSQTTEQLTASSGFPEEKVNSLALGLAKKGLIFNQANSSGLMVFRILPFMVVGLMEYMFMGELKGTEKEKELARLFEKMTYDLRDQTQNHYDDLIPLFEAMPAIDRTVPTRKTAKGKSIRIIPVEKTMTVPEEFVLPSQSVEDIIQKFDDIAVGYCFCRQRRTLLGEPCKTEAPTLNCFTFGKSARFTVAQGFAKPVTRDQALAIMKEAEDAGLVHKAFHPGSRENNPETSICNCCKDCCDTMNLWRNGTTPLVNSTYHLSVIDEDACTGCGTCMERCPTDAIDIDDQGIARVDTSSCFGCGVCSRFCPEDAISLKEGLRKVFILPPKLRP